jgi:hypothetical protein
MAGTKYLLVASVLVGLLGLVGVLAYLPAIPQLIPPRTKLPMSIGGVMVLAGVQVGILVAVFSFVGTLAGRRIGLRSAVAVALVERTSQWRALRPQLLPGALCGLLGAAAAAVMSKTLMTYLASFPIWMRLFYGGFTEEVIARWFLLSGVAWLLSRFAARGREPVAGWVIWAAIAISQVLFSGLHWPALSISSFGNPLAAVATVFVVSLPWGWLFWKFGIEAAMVAHLIFHLSISGILLLTG